MNAAPRNPTLTKFAMFAVFWGGGFAILAQYIRFFGDHWLLFAVAVAVLSFISLVVWDSLMGRRDDAELRRRFQAED